MQNELSRWIDARADDMADLLRRLVAHESENPPGRETAACARELSTAMSRLGLSAEIIPVEPQGTLVDPCIVRGGTGSGERLVYFHGHVDVVPAQHHGQFAATRHDGRITGRGSADMKGGIVSMLYGAAAAHEFGLLHGGRIEIHLVCDEETGSSVGSGYLQRNGMIDPSAAAMLTAEPSGEAIWHAARAALSVRVQVHGRPAHVGHADQGVNSFLRMLPIAASLGDYADTMRGRPTGYRVGAGEPRGSMVVVGGRSGGGSNFNVVPGCTWFTLDGRFNPEEDIDAERLRIMRTIEDAAARAGVEVTIEVTQVAPPADTAPDHPTADLLGACVGTVTGEAPRFELCAGCLDTRWYAQVGIPAFGYGPGDLAVAHGPDEFVEEAAMRRVALGYALFAGRLLG